MQEKASKPDNQQAVITRLHRIEGQIRGIAKMIEDERECKDIIMQMAAAKAALSQVGVVILTNYLANCLGEDLMADADAHHNLDEFKDLLRKWY